MSIQKKIATTVKVEETLYDQFKMLGIRHKISLQGLIERSVYRYVNEDKYREQINNYRIPVISETSTEIVTIAVITGSTPSLT